MIYSDICIQMYLNEKEMQPYSVNLISTRFLIRLLYEKSECINRNIGFEICYMLIN